jgi:hypothetical protein
MNPADGSMATTPFCSLADNNREINGFGINSNDLKLYGIIYDRSAGCSFSNFKLFKIEAGTILELGTIEPPTEAGITGNIEGAFGCISLNGDFIFRANITIAGTVYTKIGKISEVQNRIPMASISPEYSTITSSFTGRNYADWAVHPVTGDLYTYTIQTGASGVPTNGQMAKLDLMTMTIDLVGNVTNGVFLDALRDNIGGVMFGDNGKMYGVNVNTRNLYEINTDDGSIQFINTIPSSIGSQIRTDLGSCRNGNFLLPVTIESFSVQRNKETDELRLNTVNEKNITAIEIESATDGKNFSKTGSFTPTNRLQRNYYNSSFFHHNARIYYRIKITSGTTVHYSTIVKADSKTSGLVLKPMEINRYTQNFSVTVPESGNYAIQYFNNLAQNMYSQTISLQKGTQSINLQNKITGTGFFTAILSRKDSRTTAKFVLLKD